MPPLSIRTRLAYAVGDTGINLYFISTLSFLLFFYTDFYGISAAAASGVFLVARLVDAFTDPVMGYIADHTKSRWGKFRPYVLFGAVPLGLISIAVFTIPAFDTPGKIVWAYVTYTIHGVIYTVVTLPYAALTGVMTSDHDERTHLTSWRMGGALTGGLIVLSGMLPITQLFDDQASGFQVAMLLVTVTATGLLAVTFFGTRERIAIANHEAPVPLADAVNAVRRNPPLWTVVSLFVLGMIAFTCRQTSTPYYFKYTMEREDLIPSFMTATLLIMYVGLLLIPAMSEKWGKARTIQIGSVLTIVSALGFYFNAPDNIVMVYVWGCLMALGGAPIMVIGWAMIPDTVEYAQHKLNVRADGFIYSTATFLQKLGKTAAGAGIPAILALTGYIANQPQTGFALEGILFCVAVLPLIANVGLMVLAGTYSLDAAAHGRIVEALDEQHAQRTRR